MVPESLKISSTSVLIVALSKVNLFNIFESLLTLISPYSHSNAAYIIYLSVVFIADIVLFVAYRPRLRKSIWCVYFCILLWGSIGFLQILLLGFDISAFYFFIFCYDAILWTGVVVSERKTDEFWGKYSSFIFFFSIANLVIVFTTMFLRGSLVNIGTGTYQSYSYICAYCFGMIGFCFHFNRTFREKHKNAWALLPFLFVATILPGGRGAFVLLVLYSIFLLYYLIKGEKPINLKFTPVQIVIALALFFVCVFLLTYYYNSYKWLLQSGLERAVSFIDFSDFTIDLDNTSNRDYVYENALHVIGENPLFGIGIYGYNYDSGWGQYPHNIILELLMQYGIVLGVAAIVFFVYIELSVVLSKDHLIKGLSLFPLTSLMFSGSYTSTVMFWFVVMYFLTSKMSNVPLVDGVYIEEHSL